MSRVKRKVYVTKTKWLRLAKLVLYLLSDK